MSRSKQYEIRANKLAYYFTVERLTQRQIAEKCGLSLNAVKCFFSRLRRKGLLNPANVGVSRDGGGWGSRNSKGVAKGVASSEVWRVEAQQLKVRIISGSDSYARMLRSGNLVQDFEGCQLRLYPEMIEIYSRVHFFGSDVNAAYARSLEFWDGFGRRLENQFKIILIKPRANNWLFVKGCEVALQGSEIARQAEVDGSRIRLFARDDGKLWFSCDWSNGKAKGYEHETHHPVRGKLDAERIERQLWDWSLNDPRTNSELDSLVSRLVEASVRQAELNKETAAGLSAVVKLLYPSQKPDAGDIKPDDGLSELRKYTG